MAATTTASATPSVEEKRANAIADDAPAGADLVPELERQTLTRRETLSSYFTIICAGFALISDGCLDALSLVPKLMQNLVTKTTL